MNRTQPIVEGLGKTPQYWEEVRHMRPTKHVSPPLHAKLQAIDHYGNGTDNPTPPPDVLSPEAVIYLWVRGQRGKFSLRNPTKVLQFCPCWHWYNMGNVTLLGFKGVKTDDWCE
jgi:hypothetical protein